MTVLWKAGIVTGLLVSATPAGAQAVISARSGLIHYVEGQVFLADKFVQPKFGHYPEIKDGQHLRTATGRAEVLLNPGVFLRLAENTEVKMVSGMLTDTRLEVLSGSVLVECADLDDDNSVRMLFKEAAIEFRKRGLYRIDAEPGELLVYEGESVVTLSGTSTVVKGARRTPLTGMVAATKFDNKVGDPFYRWAGRRAGYLAAANLAAAKSVHDSDLRWLRNGWYFNPYLGAYTYIPSSSSYFSPFGVRYYTPNAVTEAYWHRTGYGRGPMIAAPEYNRSFGYHTGPRTIDSGAIRGSAPAPSDGGGGGGHVRGSGGASGGSSGSARGGSGRGR